MRIRRDAIFVSSVLFMMALAAWVPGYMRFVLTWHRHTLQFSDTLYIDNFYAPMGFAGLTLALIGVIVTWTGYAQRARWAWFVMFVIVWGFAFPVFLRPVFNLGWGRAYLLLDAFKHSGPNRDYLKEPLDFLLLLVALLLPIRSFFGKQSSEKIRNTLGDLHDK
jgi:hypothetical protein